MSRRVAVLASGSGSNLQALLEAELSPAKIVLVIANVEGAGALARADAAGVPSHCVPHAGKERIQFEDELLAVLEPAGVDLVVLAGFMRLLSPHFLDRYPDAVLNVHPSLLPAFPGVDAQAQAFEAGVRVAGCTVHLVDAGMDTGPILAQAAVPVTDQDDAESLRLRILAEEHRLLPRVVQCIARHGLDLEGPRPRLVLPPQDPGQALVSPQAWDPTP
ncbi:MAG: phosphoribosylglycinamide formyltransferase [Myxococcota bacterium]